MNKIVQDNGVLKVLLFTTSIVLSTAIVIVYFYATINWPYIKNLNMFHLLISCWIFFGTKSKDFFGVNGHAQLQGKHVMMLSAFFLSGFIGNNDFYDILKAISFIIVFSFFIDLKHMKKGFYWEGDISTNGYAEEDFINSIRTNFLILPTKTTEGGYLIRGYGYFIFKIRIIVREGIANIQVEPMNNGFVFLLAAKVAPGNVGQYYGEKVLKKLVAISKARS